MDQDQDLPPRDQPAPRALIVGLPDTLAAAGLCFVVTGVALIHVPSAIILAGLALVAVAAALAKIA